MKRGGKLLVLIMLLIYVLAASVVADELTVNLESRIIETFDDPEGSVWAVRGSKFISDGYPVYEYVDTYPNALFRRKPADMELKALGIQGQFDRKGYNYLEIFPVEPFDKDDPDDIPIPREIAIPGRVKSIDLWVWGSNFDYYLEVTLRDHTGRVHVLNFGSLHFLGWKNLNVSIPNYIPQSVSYAPFLQVLSLVKLTLWTRPAERVDGFYVYFDQIKVFTDLFESPYDGDSLTNPAVVGELWGEEE
jgi:hypothetical protein